MSIISPFLAGPTAETDTRARHQPSMERRPSTSRTASAVVRELRPRQWVKNGFVLAAPAAAGVLFTASLIPRLVLAVVAMCAAASATYVVNDLTDRERDRLHPTKRFRPIAAGEISTGVALWTAALLAGVALALGFGLGTGTGLAVAAYLAVTLTYSRWGKHVPYLELGGIAAGFVLRAVVGAAATGVGVSVTFLIVVAAAAAFLAIGKRYSEMMELGEDAPRHRPVLASYTLNGLERLLWGTMAVAVLGYAAWAVFAESGGDGMHPLVLSIVPMTAAALRAGRRIFAGQAGDPTALVLHDHFIQLAGACAAALVFIAIYVV